MLVIGALFLSASFGIKVQEQGGIGPRVFPMAGSLLMAGLGLLQIAGAWKSAASGTILGKDLLPAAALAGLSVIYVIGITQVGYLLSTMAAAPAVLFLFGIRSPAGLILAAVMCPAVYHLIFFVGLGVFPPYGLQFDLLDVIQGY